MNRNIPSTLIEKEMNIYLNTEKLSGMEWNSLQQLMEFKELAGKKGIAIALNNTVVPKKDWPATLLKDEDKITVIRATQGG